MKKALIIIGVLYFLFPIVVFADIPPDFCRTDKKRCDEYRKIREESVAKEEANCNRKGGSIRRRGSFVVCQGGNTGDTDIKVGDTDIKVGDTARIFSYNIIYYIVGSMIILLAIGITVKYFKDKKKVTNIVNPPVG